MALGDFLFPHTELRLIITRSFESDIESVKDKFSNEYLQLENRGSTPVGFVLNAFISSGVVGSIIAEIEYDTESVLASESMIANVTFRIQSNASGIISFMIQATATEGSEVSISQASAIALVRFRLDPNALEIHIRVIDDFGWPVEGVLIVLNRERLDYTKQVTNQNGTTAFLVSRGLNSLRIMNSDNVSISEQATLNVTESRLYTFEIFRQMIYPTRPPMIPAVEIGIGFFLGYICNRIEKRKRKPKRRKTAFQKQLEWTVLDVE